MSKLATKPKKRNAQEGMTLIEVMFAVGVLAFSFSVVYGSMVSMYMLNQINSDRVRAVASVSSMLEEISTLTYQKLASYSPPKVQGPGTKYWTNVDIINGASTISLPIQGGSTAKIPNPCEVRVTMHWYDSTGREYAFAASTMKYQ